MTILELLESKNIPYEGKPDSGQVYINCPQCKSDKKKLTISLAGRGFYCFICGFKGGSKSIAQLLNGDSRELNFDVIPESQDEPDLPPIDLKIVVANNQKLLETPEIREYLHDRGLTDDTIKKFQLGWEGRNVTIPILEGNDCVNFRLRSDPTRPNSKSVMFSIPDRGRHRLFNEAVLKTKPETIIICEGEWDCMLLDQMGYRAVTSTGGCASFKDEWIPFFKNIDKIAIVFDNDKSKNWNNPGQEAAEKLVKEFKKRGIEVQNIKLPDPDVNSDAVDVTDFFVKLGKTKEDFNKLLCWTETPNPIHSFEEIAAIVEDFLPNSTDALSLTLAVALSALSPNVAMLWLILVDAPSSGKTDLVRFLRSWENTYFLDKLTLNAFASGERETEKQKVHDLLPLLSNKCFAIKDFTALFSLDERMIKQLLGDFVNIYDREFAKFSASRGLISHESEFSLLGAITPAALNRHHNYMDMIGARFLMYTMPPSTEDQEEESLDKILEQKEQKKLRRETELKIRGIICQYLNQLQNESVDIKNFNQPVKGYLKLCAKLVAHSRGIATMKAVSFVSEDKDKGEQKKVTYYEPLVLQIEKPYRAFYQLIELAEYLAKVHQVDEVGEAELTIIKDIVMSSMPADRSQALRSICLSNGEVTAKDLVAKDKSWRTSKRLLDELWSLGVLKKDSGAGQVATRYEIEPRFKNLLLLPPREFMSTNYRAIETTNGEIKESQTILGEEPEEKLSEFDDDGERLPQGEEIEL